jgi:hypothetical protein
MGSGNNRRKEKISMKVNRISVMRSILNKMKSSTYLYLLFASISNASIAQELDASIRSAKTAYNQVKLKESRLIFSKIIESPTASHIDKAEAFQNIGIQDWVLFQNYEESNKNLTLALQQNISKSKTYLLLSQVNLEASRFSQAYRSIENSLTESQNEVEKLDASLFKAQIIHDESVVLLKRGTSPDKGKLLAASDLLKFVLQKRPGSPAPAELLVGISLMRKNGSDILKAWKSYYFITDERSINVVLLPSYKVLNSILPDWNQQKLTDSKRTDLIKALASSNFYEYAHLIASCELFGSVSKPILDNEEIIQILNFHQFIEGIKKVNSSFYPKIAIGTKGYETDYTNAITSEAKTLWIQMDKQNIIENYTEDRFFALIEKKYGALGYIGNTNGFMSMLLGLIIHNEVKEVNQYGYKADFRYVSISRLISKDFTTWHGSANVGGWGTETSMIQVRDAYLQAPFTRLGWVTDASAHAGVVDKIDKAKAIDLTNCQKDKYSEPSYLMMAFRLKASESLYGSLQKLGLQDESLSIAFINETLRLNIESTVFAHEARHAIDQLLFKKEFDTMTDDEKELRAKFSEIAFAPKFKMASTGSILGGDLDVTTSHGKANFRLRKIIVDWMEKHSNEIIGLDKTVPVVMQMTLLSDEQMVAICKEADPLASIKK